MCLFNAKTVIFGCGAIEHKEEKVEDCRRAECVRSRQHPKCDGVHRTGCTDLKETQCSFESNYGKCQHGCSSPHQDKSDVKYMLAISKIYDDTESYAMPSNGVKIVREAVVGHGIATSPIDSE